MPTTNSRLSARPSADAAPNQSTTRSSRRRVATNQISSSPVIAMPGQVASVESSARTLAPTSSHRGGSGSRRMRTTAALTARMSARSNFWFAYTQKKGVATMRATATSVGNPPYAEGTQQCGGRGDGEQRDRVRADSRFVRSLAGQQTEQGRERVAQRRPMGVRALTVRRPVGAEVRSDQALLEQVPHMQGVAAVDAAGVVVAERQEQQRQPGRGHAEGHRGDGRPPEPVAEITARRRRAGRRQHLARRRQRVRHSAHQWSRERTMRSASSAIDPIMSPAMMSRTVLVATFTGLAMTS